MKVVYIVSEAYPFIKEGSIGDVAGSFPKYVSREGIKIIVCLPLYKHIDRKRHNIVETDIKFDVVLAGKKYNFKVFKYKDNVKFYFFSNDRLFKEKKYI